MSGPTAPDERWAEWLEPLRPDDVARARMQAGIRDRAEPLLARRRRRALLDAAERLARRLTPLAAAAAVLFGWLAFQATPEPAGTEPVAVERLLQPEAGEGPPAFLVSASAPAAEHAFEATLEPSGSR